ncbi:hypothetical protein H8S10_14885 [Clostridium sp. NSJ-49]|uniref:Uncharacterized protein n=1 Tax=Clostridium disporicum TaxID=84024 RepID=A0A174FM35_9CLOT|nr:MULTISPECIES: hypothetical protein [Clostridium]MBC5626732.1 hypothetical protein [Clostridium sp. NSJ-49]MCD2501509.1 hypothetical protein [Clostridium sp. NSJ-145]CUO51332.1 Uncharacterised protein [Clostridium disporicum]
MKLNIIMRTMSILVAVSIIFIIVLYEPNAKKENEFDEISSSVIEETIEEKSVSSDQEVIQGYTSDILTISLDNIINELTLDERSVVKSILDKLSVIDCAKVNSILNSGSIDSKEEALSYIKKRLIEEDYNRLEGILNQYIELV